jgi:class 3 adenylate cyclase
MSLLGHDHIAELSLGDVVATELTVVFTDIKGFTQALENLPPQEAFEWLNRCYRIMGPEVRRSGGFVDKYIGDAVMALFPRSPDDALRASLAMHRGVRNFPDISLVSGIHFGRTVVGTLGEPERFDATVLSDVVNVASRIEGIGKILSLPILVSEESKRQLQNPEAFLWRDLGRVKVKGRENPLKIFELLDDQDPRSALKMATAKNFESGVQAFAASQFGEAMKSFGKVLAQLEDDGPTLFYLERCMQLKDHAQGFDGILVFQQKSS